MTEPPSKFATKSLVSSILAATPSPAGGEGEQNTLPNPASDAAQALAAPPVVDPETEARELIAVYFELEEPTERDVLFEKLIALDVPAVADFLRAMMEEDDDEFVRAAATSELARRGVPEAISALEADLTEPAEFFFFANAVETLADIRGPGFYDTLAAIFRDPARDADERRQAMLGMESVDTPRALADFVTFVAEQHDLAAMSDDQVEVAMLAFARHNYQEARPALVALHARIAVASDLDSDSREELVGFVQEGIDLLDAED